MLNKILLVGALAPAVIVSLLWLQHSKAPQPTSVNAASQLGPSPQVELMAQVQKSDANAPRVQPSGEEASITISFHSPVSLLLTDPSGRRLGDDPSTRASYDEIPRAYYEAAGLEDDETGQQEDDPAKSMFIPAPIPGQYRLKVSSTAEGAYSADFAVQRSEGSNSSVSLQNVPIALNQTQTFTLTYGTAAKSSLHLTGGPHADDPKPDLVNHLLSSLFHPRPGTSESVALPIKIGHKFLDLTVSGNIAGKIVSDTNRLVFDVVARGSAQ
jgi:hypothetical protein